MKTASGLVDAQTENPSAPGYFDCSKPTVLLLHGWGDRPSSTWMTCLADALHDDSTHFPEGVNVLLADAQSLMSRWQPSLIEFTEGGGLTGVAADDVHAARRNIPVAAPALDADLSGHLACGSALDIRLVIGHSYGGAIAAQIAARLYARRPTGTSVGRLIAIDTPWQLTGLREERQDAQLFTDCAVNIYSTQLWRFGFGTTLDNYACTINMQKNRGLLHECPWWQADHNCLAEQFCSWFQTPEGMSQAFCGFPCGTYMHEIDQEWVWFDGPGDPPPIPPDDLYGYTAILGATDHVLDPNLIDQIDDFWPGLRPRRR